MKIRARFTKVGRVRWTSHRDVARMWERALRRARMPVSYTAGFTPRPQLSFGLALPTGCESRGEYLDLRLGPAEPGDIPVAQLPEARACKCGAALAHAILTDRKMISAATKKRLAPIISKYIS